MNSDLSHAGLVALAKHWLATREKCAVVITEMAVTGETPDAIGWHGYGSILVECKVSRSDFISDRRKHFRCIPEFGCGLRRYFLTPANMVCVSELPSGWGLLETDGQKVKRIHESEVFEASTRQEIVILLSAIRRIGSRAPNGISVKFYTIDSGNSATLGVDCDAQE